MGSGIASVGPANLIRIQLLNHIPRVETYREVDTHGGEGLFLRIFFL